MVAFAGESGGGIRTCRSSAYYENLSMLEERGERRERCEARETYGWEVGRGHDERGEQGVGHQCGAWEVSEGDWIRSRSVKSDEREKGCRGRWLTRAAS